MVRTADGKTIVTVDVSGLTAGETHGSHVHEQASRRQRRWPLSA